MLGSSDSAFDDMIQGSTLVVPPESIGGEALLSDEGITIVFTDVKLFGSTLGFSDEIKLGVDDGYEMVSSGGSFDGANDVKLVVLLLGDPLG